MNLNWGERTRNTDRTVIMKKAYTIDQGSIELVVLGLLAALVVVLAIPLIGGVDDGSLDTVQSSSETVITNPQQTTQ